MLSDAAQIALTKLEHRLKSLQKIAVAFSGGMDSAFLGLAAKRFLNENVRAFFITTEAISQEEILNAQTIAKTIQIDFFQFNLSLLEVKEVQDNPPDRCYYCKKFLFSFLLKNVPKDWALCDGSTPDDRSDFRPGARAIAELGVLSPLDETGFQKSLIREVLHSWNAENLIQTSQTCLATRIPSGTPLSLKSLRQVEAGEIILRQAGFKLVRLRHYGDLAKIEIASDQLPQAFQKISPLLPLFKEIGFSHISLDLEGYKRGAMNREET